MSSDDIQSPVPFAYDPPQGPLEIIHQDRDMVVINKPSGLLSIPGRYHEDSALSRLAADHDHVYAVHRLDMYTSGLLIVALRRKAEAELHRQFREREVAKVYVAVVHGAVATDRGVIDRPLRREGGQPPLSVVDLEDGKPARTRFEVLERTEARTRLRLYPETGRSHQLRVHMLSEGHPIVGDPFYGVDESTPGRMLLHAAKLTFKHPFSGAPVTLESAPRF